MRRIKDLQQSCNRRKNRFLAFVVTAQNVRNFKFKGEGSGSRV